MIAFLKGKPAGSGSDFIVVDVGGVGYKVFVPTTALSAVGPDNGDITLYTYLNVREDAMQLFGFLTENDLELFEMIIQVSGIGPKMGLAILSSMPSQSFIQAVINDQLDILTRIPGVGKKTAQRVIIELKDKLGKIAQEKQAVVPALAGGFNDVTGDALQALVALGYNPVEARRALGRITSKEKDLTKPEDIVRFALKELGKY